MLVHLWNNVTTSQLDLCYSIIPDTDHTQTLGTQCRGDVQGQIDLQATYNISVSGIYFIMVYANSGGQDSRNPYLISIDQVVDPDTNEPNNDKDHATPVTAGIGIKGYISYLGDQDWFKIDVSGTDQMLQIGLTTDAASELDLEYDVYLPDLTPLNSGDAYDENNPININDMLALPQAGTYYIVIKDKQDDVSSTTVGYTLTLNLVQNPDPRDRSTNGNNSPAYASPISSGAAIVDAYIASRGDEDWYIISIDPTVVNLSQPKLLEIDVNFPSGSAITPAADLLLSDNTTTCVAGDTCAELSFSCQDPRCFTGQCTTDNNCQGGGVCLPSGYCAIRPLIMTASSDPLQDWSVSGNPRHLQTVAPMYGSDYYLFVRDFQGQHYDATNPYSITATVRTENDTNENNGLYLPYATEQQDQDLRGMNLKYATKINCSLSGADYVCAPITGYLSFRGDQDWYELDGIPDQAEAAPLGMSTKVDWGFQIAWTNSSSVIDLNLELFMSGSLQDSDELMSWHHPGTGSGTIGIGECAYICGEYQDKRPLYLRVQHSDRTIYDYSNPYTLTITVVPGCPLICGTCKPTCNCYACPTSQNPNPNPSLCDESKC